MTEAQAAIAGFVERTVLERHDTAHGELQLQARPSDGGVVYEIIFNGMFLMSSDNALSEMELARLTLAPLIAQGRRELRVLLGGLGLGISLRELLKYPEVGRVDVVELEPTVVAWNQGPLRQLCGDALADPRVVVHVQDLKRYLLENDTFDAIMLDVDNGPSWLLKDGNACLYGTAGLRRMQQRLAPNGVLTFWAAQPEAEFARLLQLVFGASEELPVAYQRGKYQLCDFVYRVHA
jgi:spermidine synthase